MTSLACHLAPTINYFYIKLFMISLRDNNIVFLLYAIFRLIQQQQNDNGRENRLVLLMQQKMDKKKWRVTSNNNNIHLFSFASIRFKWLLDVWAANLSLVCCIVVNICYLHYALNYRAWRQMLATAAIAAESSLYGNDCASVRLLMRKKKSEYKKKL